MRRRQEQLHVSATDINKDGYLPFPQGFTTAAIHAGQESEQWSSMPMVTPIVTTSNHKHLAPNVFKGYTYGRDGNPTRDVLQKCLASLENGKYAFCFSSGIGAVTSILGLLKSGDHVICGDDMYGGVSRAFDTTARQFGIESTLVEARDLKNIENAIKPNTKMIWTETPTNPTLKVIDLKGVAQIARKNNILSVIDNTFLTSYLQRPLDFGIDIVMQSLTKYMNGHSDVIMGALITNREDIKEKMLFIQESMGIISSPFDCFQVLRGLKTLELRMHRHMENAMVVTKYLQSHPKVERVVYPGLPSHPQHELFKKQTCGPSGMFSFYVKGGIEQAKKFVGAVKVFTLAESLGGYGSLVQIPSLMTHEMVPQDLRKHLGITDNFIRVSVGLENVEDLCNDLEQALSQL